MQILLPRMHFLLSILSLVVPAVVVLLAVVVVAVGVVVIAVVVVVVLGPVNELFFVQGRLTHIGSQGW